MAKTTFKKKKSFVSARLSDETYKSLLTEANNKGVKLGTLVAEILKEHAIQYETKKKK